LEDQHALAGGGLFVPVALSHDGQARPSPLRKRNICGGP
jgi:hypothetical protein